VYAEIQENPKMLAEIVSIEKANVKITAAAAKKDTTPSICKHKKERTGKETKVIAITKTDWLQNTSWAATILIESTLIWSISQKNKLKEQITSEKQQLKQQIEKEANTVAEAEKLITIFGAKDIISIALAAQKISPNSCAKVH